MNDLQDLIATNAIRAYNEGFERGVAAEQERIIELLPRMFETYFAKDKIVEETTIRIRKWK
jgi:hypothetical protein